MFSGQISKLKPAATLLWQAQARDISGFEDRLTYGLPAESGVLLLDVPVGSDAAEAGLMRDDVIISCNSVEAKTVADMRAMADQAAGRTLTFAVIRKQKQMTLELSDYAYVVRENLWTTEFKTIPVAVVADVVPAKVSFGGADLNKDAVALLIDGKVAVNRGPTFANGVDTGKYRFDLADVKSIARVNTYASGNTRARQSFTLYGSSATADPGWNVADPAVFTPVINVDSRLVCTF